MTARAGLGIAVYAAARGALTLPAVSSSPALGWLIVLTSHVTAGALIARWWALWLSLSLPASSLFAGYEGLDGTWLLDALVIAMATAVDAAMIAVGVALGRRLARRGAS